MLKMWPQGKQLDCKFLNQMHMEGVFPIFENLRFSLEAQDSSTPLRAGRSYTGAKAGVRAIAQLCQLDSHTHFAELAGWCKAVKQTHCAKYSCFIRKFEIAKNVGLILVNAYLKGQFVTSVLGSLLY